ncbi:hypothetical protein K8R43_01485 [archaeon]|nr:hypothetical protein [archaeon]
MNKKLAMLPALILLAGMAMAAPGFQAHKDVWVTGDWAWDGASWQNGNYLTASYNYDVVSPKATSAYYIETEKSVGTPWKYGLKMSTGANAPGRTHSVMHVTTVNDPETTPATGGYTQYKFASNSFGDFTNSHLSVSGEGWAHVDTTTVFDSGFTQNNFVNINHGW